MNASNRKWEEAFQQLAPQLLEQFELSTKAIEGQDLISSNEETINYLWFLLAMSTDKISYPTYREKATCAYALSGCMRMLDPLIGIEAVDELSPLDVEWDNSMIAEVHIVRDKLMNPEKDIQA